MKKRISLFIIVMLIVTALTACGGVKQGTMEDTAKTFVQALIDGNEDVLNEINKSGPMNFPTHYLMSDYAPEFADFKISDFSFDVNEEKEIVEIVKKGEEKAFKKLKISKIGDKYYFLGF